MASVSIFIEPNSQVSAHAQIKDQIKLACVQQQLKPGDALPSIRQLARQMRLGDGVVRRAYRELREQGLLVTSGKKHVVGPLAGASKADVLLASSQQCDRLIRWARQHHVSAFALSRLLLRQTLVREISSPSYLFVDMCTVAAERSAAAISKAWEIRVAGVPVGGFADHWRRNARDVSAVLVNEHLHKDVIAAVGEFASRVFPIRTRVDERLRRRLGRLRNRSAVLLVGSDEDLWSTGRSILGHCKRLVGGRCRIHVRNVSKIKDLAGFIRTQKRTLVLFSPLTWETLPARIKRMVAVAPAFSEPDPQSLEETRIAAGVLL